MRRRALVGDIGVGNPRAVLTRQQNRAAHPRNAFRHVLYLRCRADKPLTHVQPQLDRIARPPVAVKDRIAVRDLHVRDRRAIQADAPV